MATSASIPIGKPNKSARATDSTDSSSNTLQILINEAEQNLPIRKLKRLLGAAMNDSDADRRLIALGEDPDALRKELEHIMNTDSIYLIKKFNGRFSTEEFDRRVTNAVNRAIPQNEKIIWLYDNKAFGDAFPGSYDCEITDITRYVIVTLDGSAPRVQLLEVEETEDVWTGNRANNTLEIKFVKMKVDLSLYQIIAMHPKLIERVVLIVGGYEELIKCLK